MDTMQDERGKKQTKTKKKQKQKKKTTKNVSNGQDYLSNMLSK